MNVCQSFMYLGLVVSTLISSFFCLYVVLRSAEYSDNYAKSYADAIGYKGKDLAVAKLQIMPHGGAYGSLFGPLKGEQSFAITNKL